MKQIIAILITLGLFLTYENAFSQSGLLLGARGGASLAKLKGTGDFINSDASISRVVRYQGGVDLGFQFGSLSAMTGIRYLQRGVKTSENRDDPNGKYWVTPDGRIDVGERIYTSKFSFIGVPVLARYRLGSGPIQFGLALGPQFNIGMGQVTEVYEDNFFNSGLTINEYTYDYGKAGDDLLKKSNVSFVFMPEVAFNVSPSGIFKVNLILESSGDMLNKSYLIDTGNGVRKVNGSIKSNAFALEVGYEHRLNFNVGVKY